MNKRPKQEEFIEWDRFGDGHVNSVRYAEALDKYCDELEDSLEWWKRMYARLAHHYWFLKFATGVKEDE